MLDEPWSDGKPCTWCDICGWGDTVGDDQLDNPYHFCHRHSADDVLRFMSGYYRGYFDMAIPDSNNPLDRIHNARLDAEQKAWSALAGYKFYMFGYWAAAWVKYNQLMPKEEKLPNPFRALVNKAREEIEDRK
jgi:hypothetical protein